MERPGKAMTFLYENPTFLEAISDIESLGVKVSEKSLPGAQAYAVAGGRSNARWWLIPLHNSHVTSAGFALFQPILAGARAMKLGVCMLSRFGMSRLWVKHKIYISGESILGHFFPGMGKPYYAYFTGTDSPHRKVAVQIMDGQGRLKGFAKLSRNPRVGPLLLHEAAILRIVSSLDLQSAYIPQIVFAGRQNESTLLVTDTLKTSFTRSTTRLTGLHLAFLDELAGKSDEPPQSAAAIGTHFATRISTMRRHLNQDWCRRLDAATNMLNEGGDFLLPVSLSHGDFTPWNTFLVQGRLYVFDWEYAEKSLPITNDIIHFVLNEPHLRPKPAAQKLDAISARLNQVRPDLPKEPLKVLFIIYLLTHVLRQVERLPVELIKNSEWDGADEQQQMLDILLQGMKGLES
jgi:hypothetical protein